MDGNCAVGCGPGTDYLSIHIFQCRLERTDAIMKEVLEPITFVLAYPTVLCHNLASIGLLNVQKQSYADLLQFIQSKLHGLSPRANYADRAVAASRRS